MSSPASGWISFWEQNLLADQQNFLWSDPGLVDGALKGDSFNIQSSSLTYSTENDNSKGDSLHQESRTSLVDGVLKGDSFKIQSSSLTCTTEDDNSKGDSLHQKSRKRSRDDGSNGVQGKASREKMRRDRMNDRFVELSTVLEPDKLPKTDKASILSDAVRIINQLRAEAQQYREANRQLHETIKELKAEKNELREEKLSLKAEKETLESQLKMVQVLPALPSIQSIGPSPSSGSQTNHSFYTKAAVTPSLYAQQQDNSIFGKLPAYSDMPFSVQWIPSEVADVSKDHVLRPPVA